ncbi:MAG: RHS repeat-associated core domain-containing protein [Candidatus Acidiferrales bacterium]
MPVAAKDKPHLETPAASYYRARYYDPINARFFSEDPAGFWAGGNFYRYVGNHSTDLVDPSGLLQVCCRPANVGAANFWADISLKPAPCHCFLKLSDGTTLGGYHHFWPWSGASGALDLRRNTKSDDDKHGGGKATCTPIRGACDGRAINAFNSASKDLGGYGFGANDYGTSNDAAAGLLKNMGIGFTLPACAWGKGTGTIPEGPNLNPGGGFPFQFMP